MKKTSIFIIFVSFILSIFLISFYGMSVRDDHMKVYIGSVEIETYDGQLDSPDGKLKYKRAILDSDSGYTQIFIDYSVKDAKGNDQPDLYESIEFKIIEGNGTFDVEGKEYPYAEIVSNAITFYHACAVKVQLSSTDGTNVSDFCQFICKDHS